MERLHSTRDAFLTICERFWHTIGLKVSESEIKQDMQRGWAQAQESNQNGDWNIRHLAMKYFDGMKSTVVNSGIVYVSKTFEPVHELIYEQYPQLKKELSAVSAFYWLLRFPFRRIGIRGILEKDNDVIFPGFPAEQYAVDQNALDQFAENNHLIKIRKAEYSF